jgi:ABC-type glycerol-3-phosphate transport system substrate-binding protein
VEAMAEKYMAKNPDVKITVEEYPWDAYFQTLEVRFAADDPNIDVVIMDIPMMAGYAERGYIDPMTDFIPESEFSSKISAGTLNAITYNGEIMAGPLQNSDQYLYINADMAAAAGVELPSVVVDNDTVITEEFATSWGEAAWTWEEVVDAAMKMKQDTNNDGIVDVYGLHIEQATRLYQLQPLGGSRGGSIVSPDGKSVKGYFDQPVWQDAVRFYYDLFNTWEVEPPSCLLPGYDNGAEFINGSFAMMVGGGWNMRTIMESDINVVVAAHPYFADGKSTTPTGSWVTGIGSASTGEKKAAAADFLEWWNLSEEGTQLWYDLGHELPATNYMLDQIATNEKYDEFPTSAQRLGAWQVLNTAEGRPVTPYYPIVNEGFEKAFMDAAQGVDPEKALKEAVAMIEKNIERVQ